jgi:hypothetical protein
MRHILSNLPEKLSHEEIDEMLRTADKVRLGQVVPGEALHPLKEIPLLHRRKKILFKFFSICLLVCLSV